MSIAPDKLSKQEVKRELWRRGVLVWKCHPVQKEMYELYYNSKRKNSIFVWLLARQSGKSWLLAVLALEAAIRTPNSIIKMVTDTKLHLSNIFEPLFQEILIDCPEDLKPQYQKAKYTYCFSNGSQIQLAGSDGKHYEKLRGQKATLVLVDEAGFCRDLHDMMTSVLLLTTTHTGGNLILASTPPKHSEHDFNRFIELAEKENLLVKKTVYDNPLLTSDQIERLAESMGGKHSEQFRREFLCENIKDSTTSVIPEFTEDLEKEIVKEWERPPYFDCYESMDLGGKDLTVVLFYYYDFKAAKIIIEDELVMDFGQPHQNIESLTQNIKEKENILWLNPLTHEVKVPYLRVSDINYIVTQEISKYSNYKINFIATKKDDSEAAINVLKIMLASKKIIIHPRCQTLIRHLRNVRWASANNKSTFARSPDNGHYDAVDALKYAVRSVLYNKNPYPHGYNLNLNSADVHVQNAKKFYTESPSEMYRRIFNIKRKR